MSQLTAPELLERALDLPAAERLNLATELLRSVEAPEDDEWNASWRAELDRREQEAESGSAHGESWSNVKARLLGELGDR
jgi:putative addiction module component (TIGR02574 family)